MRKAGKDLKQNSPSGEDELCQQAKTITDTPARPATKYLAGDGLPAMAMDPQQRRTYQCTWFLLNAPSYRPWWQGNICGIEQDQRIRERLVQSRRHGVGPKMLSVDARLAQLQTKIDEPDQTPVTMP